MPVVKGAPAIDVQLLDRPVRPLDVAPIPDEAGAECVFLGRTRREVHPSHGPLVRLTYQVYRPLAARVLDELALRAAESFGCRAVRIHHAVGDVPVGEASVLVQVVSGHRDEAFRACRYLIDTLKRSAPIWKQERWADGTTWSRGTAAQPPGEP